MNHQTTQGLGSRSIPHPRGACLGRQGWRPADALQGRYGPVATAALAARV